MCGLFRGEYDATLPRFDDPPTPDYVVTPMQHPKRQFRRLALAAILAATAGGCETPIGDGSDRLLRQSVIESARRELGDVRQVPQSFTTTRGDSVKALGIKPEIMTELETMAGPGLTTDKPTLRPNILGKETKVRMVSLQRAILLAVDNNLSVQFARLSPAISEAQLVAADAAFDWVFFSNLNYNSLDQPRNNSLSGRNPFQADQVESQIGLRRSMISGGQLTVQQELGYLHNDEGFQSPNPSSSAAVTLQLDQPLLRGFGSDVALAEVRLQRNAERTQIAALRRELIKQVSDTERQYWQLVRAHKELQISQRLLVRGEDTHKQVKGREQLDATPSQIASAAARVEQRKADVIRADTALRQASDRLKTLINDPDTPVGSEILLLPADDAVDAPLTFSPLEAVESALTQRPEIEQSILSIDDASIRRVVQDNARLPRLDLRFQMRFQDLDRNMGRAFTSELDGNFVDYVTSLVFEQPIGNRRAEADFRRRTLERQQAVISYRNTVQQILLELLTAMRNAVTNYELIDQTKASRVATSEELRALLVEKATIRGFTVERLNIELNAQERLAQAERDEVNAVITYNTSISDLWAAMGRTLERNRIAFKVPTAADAAEARPPLNVPREEEKKD